MKNLGLSQFGKRTQSLHSSQKPTDLCRRKFVSTNVGKRQRKTIFETELIQVCIIATDKKNVKPKK